jgi:MFS family permease
MGILLDGFDLFIIALALPLLQQSWALTAVQAGMVAAAAPAGAVFGALLIGPIIDRVGRRRVLLICPFLFVLFAALCALAPNLTILLLGRFVLGMGIGADYPLSASYVAEFMPSEVRGRMMVAAFSLQSVGALTGAIVGVLVLVLAPELKTWRWMLGLGVIPAIVVWVARLHAPESPMWHRPSEQTGRGHLWQVARWKKKLALVTLPWFILDAALYGIGLYSPAILVMAYRSTGMMATSRRSLLADDLIATANTVLLDLFLVVGFVFAIFLVERWGRVMLQSLGFIGMASGLAVAAWGASSLPMNIPLLLIGVALSNLCSTLGPNATTYLLPAELFPTSVRATAHGLAASFGKLGAVLSTLFLPVLTSWGMESTFALGSGICLAAALLTLTLGEETMGTRLDA